MTRNARRGHRPDTRSPQGAGRGVQSERSESRSDGTAALDSTTGAPTITTRGDALMTTDEVAGWLRVSPATLCRWRQCGSGPPALWLARGVPRYRRDDVQQWLNEVAA